MLNLENFENSSIKIEAFFHRKLKFVKKYVYEKSFLPLQKIPSKVLCCALRQIKMLHSPTYAGGRFSPPDLKRIMHKFVPI